MTDSFKSRTTLKAGNKDYDIYSLKALEKDYNVSRLPYSLKVMLENLLRHENGVDVTREQIEALANWDAKAEPDTEIAFTPARVILQDFTGVPAIVDLAAMRDAMTKLGGDATSINPLSPAELVIDHSVQVDHFGVENAFNLNAKIEFQRNKERYAFLRWGQNAFDNFKVVPPDVGIVHQVNIEYLARVVFDKDNLAYPDTLVGTDSHTTMVNGLGVLGWGVGGIEAEAAMLGQAITMLIPQVIGFKLEGDLREGTTATDLVLTVTEMLREKGVVGKFVEFYGDGLKNLPLADRATLGNMSPEFGSTCAIFPVDNETLRYMRLTGRDEQQITLVEEYAKAQGMWREDGAKPADYTDTLTLDLDTVEASIAGPKRPQDRIALSAAKATFRKVLSNYAEPGNTGTQQTVSPVDESSEESFPASDAPSHDQQENGAGSPRHVDTNNGPVNYPSNPSKVFLERDQEEVTLDHGAVVIAAITSCTNTSNPAVMLASGLLARNAINRGLDVKPWVKTSLAPGSKVVTDYLEKAGLLDDLEKLGFGLVGYGCTTCIGNSGPLAEEISATIKDNDLAAAAVLSGNRNFEGRIHPDVKMNFLASPPLVVAYALAGSMHVDLLNDSLGQDKDGKDVYMKDIWPTEKEIQDFIVEHISDSMFQKSYSDVFQGDDNWNKLDVTDSETYDWQEDSTYVQNPPYFVDMTKEPAKIPQIKGARVLALLGDSITTDHISPAGAIKKDSPAGKYLMEQGVKPADFNSYGSRRGNHEVMMRGTFANVRLRNLLAPGTEGGITTHIPSNEEMSIFDASMKYQQDDTPLLVIAGSEYGSGSSRDWAAKGTLLLGVKAVLATSYERIHRSNLIGMGVMPLQFKEGDDYESLGLTGKETFDISGMEKEDAKEVTITAKADDGKETTFTANVRLDTPKERDYYKHGGILHYVLRQLAA